MGGEIPSSSPGSLVVTPELAQRIYNACKEKEGWSDTLESTDILGIAESGELVCEGKYRDDTKPHLLTYREIRLPYLYRERP